MFTKKANSILAVALILGVLGVAAVAMAAPANNGMPCSDPAFRQQMLDSHVKGGFMTQEQADLMGKNMDQMMTGGQINPMMPYGPQGNPPASTPGK
jgi:hypothetical protein